MSDTVFHISNLGVWYGEKHALKDVTVDIPIHAITACIGPSGCGKSTFLRELDRMNDLVDGCRHDGSIELNGQDIFEDIDVLELRRRVGMVFQRPNPFPMSIFDNVAYGPRLYGLRNRDRLMDLVERSLRQASLWDEVRDRLKESAFALSGGQQQRLCIARTLAVKPEVILMDEPTSALDPIATSNIERLMTELKKDYTIVVVTHNMQQASRISDQTCFFLLDGQRTGYLVEHGPTEELFFRPKDKRTEDYLSGRFG